MRLKSAVADAESAVAAADARAQTAAAPPAPAGPTVVGPTPPPPPASVWASRAASTPASAETTRQQQAALSHRADGSPHDPYGTRTAASVGSVRPSESVTPHNDWAAAAELRHAERWRHAEVQHPHSWQLRQAAQYSAPRPLRAPPAPPSWASRQTARPAWPSNGQFVGVATALPW